MKKIISTSFLLMTMFASATAPVFSCNDGVASFISFAPLEIIKAQSKELRGAVNVSARTFLFAVNINSFEGFNSGLQQEHFNENYMETNKYPEATFRGKIIEEVDLTKDGKYSVRAKGILGLHGVNQERIINGTIEVKSGTLRIHSNFSVLLEDHNIIVPRVVHQKISPEIEVNIDALLRQTK